MTYNFLFFVFGGISSAIAGLCLLFKWKVDGQRRYDLAWAIAILSYSVGVVLAGGQYDRGSIVAGGFAVLMFWIFAAGMVVGNLSFAERPIYPRIIGAAFVAALVLSFPLGLHLGNSLAVFTTIGSLIFFWTGWEVRKLPSIGQIASWVFYLRAALLLARPLFPAGAERAPLVLVANLVTVATGLVLLFGSVLRSRDLLRQHELALNDANAALAASSTDLRAQYEATAKALGQAEAAILAKRMFITNMSHELRTPLTAILGFTEMIKRRADTATLAEIGAYADYANQGGAEMLKKVDRILEFIDIDELHVPATVPFNPAEALKQETALQQQGLAAKQLSLRMALAMEPPCAPLRGDARLFRIIVRELLANAIKAAPPQTAVAVELDHQDGVSRLRISDSGAGMPASFVRTIGESFNVDGPVFNRGGDAQGLGLGLSLVTRYAQQIGATLAVSPNTPSGTVAEMRFPHDSAMAAASPTWAGNTAGAA